LSQAKPLPKQINLKSLSMQAGLKFSGCPTQPEPILETRVVYEPILLDSRRKTFLLTEGEWFITLIAFAML
jgi:hypothetical protein